MGAEDEIVDLEGAIHLESSRRPPARAVIMTIGFLPRPVEKVSD